MNCHEIAIRSSGVSLQSGLYQSLQNSLCNSAGICLDGDYFISLNDNFHSWGLISIYFYIQVFQVIKSLENKMPQKSLQGKYFPLQ